MKFESQVRQPLKRTSYPFPLTNEQKRQKQNALQAPCPSNAVSYKQLTIKEKKSKTAAACRFLVHHHSVKRAPRAPLKTRSARIVRVFEMCRVIHNLYTATAVTTDDSPGALRRPSNLYLRETSTHHDALQGARSTRSNARALQGIVVVRLLP